MAKRYIDSEMFDRAWFRRLPCRIKCAWTWLSCNCSEIGIWNIDMEKLSFEVGEPVTLLELQEHFKVEVFDENKLMLPTFVPFQYGDAKGLLSPTNPFHQAIAKKMEDRGFPRPSFKDSSLPESKSDTPTGGSPPESPRRAQGKGRGRGKGSVLHPLAKLWNEAADPSLPRVDTLGRSSKRLTAAVARWEEHSDIDFWLGVIAKINLSNFCRGGGDRGWKANFGWLVRPDTASEVLEGKYDDRKAQGSRPAQGVHPFIATRKVGNA